MDLRLLNKLLPPPLTNPFFRTPGEALDAVIAPIQQQTGIPGSYQFIEQGIGRLLNPRPRVGAIPPSANGESYRRAELRLADAARPGGGGGGGGNAGYSVPRPLGGTPQERAQAAETARIAQLTAQDPELKRYKEASKKAKTQEEMDAARDIGMQIWQQKYGNTPMAQPGGVIGINNPLMQSTFGYQTGSAPGQQIGAPTLGPSPLVPQVDQSLNPASPNYIGGEGAPLMDFTREEVTPELIAAYQKQLLEQAAASRK